VFRQVVMPLCLPGIAAGALMIFNVNMGGFSSTALIGAGKILTLPIVIQRTVILETNYGLGAALAALLLVVVLVINAFSVLLLLRARRGMIV
jgi:putative spermidine/putrescine transport system permease protein